MKYIKLNLNVEALKDSEIQRKFMIELKGNCRHIVQ